MRKVCLLINLGTPCTYVRTNTRGKDTRASIASFVFPSVDTTGPFKHTDSTFLFFFTPLILPSFVSYRFRDLRQPLQFFFSLFCRLFVAFSPFLFSLSLSLSLSFFVILPDREFKWLAAPLASVFVEKRNEESPPGKTFAERRAKREREKKESLLLQDLRNLGLNKSWKNPARGRCKRNPR